MVTDRVQWHNKKYECYYCAFNGAFFESSCPRSIYGLNDTIWQSVLRLGSSIVN